MNGDSVKEIEYLIDFTSNVKQIRLKVFPYIVSYLYFANLRTCALALGNQHDN